MPDLLLFGLLAVLLLFMIFNTRKRSKRLKAEQEEKATKTVPGVKVLLQGGLYGTIVAYDHEDLDSPALIQIAPGTIIEVHSQAILRVVEPKDAVADDSLTEEPLAGTSVTDAPVVVSETVVSESVVDEVPAPKVDDRPADGTDAPVIETAEQTRARLDRDADDK